MAIISSFKETTILKAFILNSIASMLVIIIALIIKDKFDKKLIRNNTGTMDSISNIFLIMLGTFITSMLAYTLMYFLFGFGEGMMVCS